MSLDPSVRPGDLVCVEERCPQFGKSAYGRLCPGCGQLMEPMTGAPLVPRRSSPAATGVVVSPAAPADLTGRLLARVIDTVVGFVPLFLVALVYPGTAASRADDPVFTAASLAAYLFLLLYEFVMLAACDGQTVGKRLMKTKVVKLDGQPIGWGSAAGRVYVWDLLAVCTGGLAGLLFALSPLFDSGPYRRGWHDRIASTVVIRSGA